MSIAEKGGGVKGLVQWNDNRIAINIEISKRLDRDSAGLNDNLTTHRESKHSVVGHEDGRSRQTARYETSVICPSVNGRIGIHGPGILSHLHAPTNPLHEPSIQPPSQQWAEVEQE